ncbi:GTPase Era [Jonesia quinghaiensis]|uniref:GTPase Era n=1 Tax=Jonesia quinghaiensis TaxID=262806 RepID=UPI000427BF47|nr:GTPase Era [Jonesia quinghaiensis]
MTTSPQQPEHRSGFACLVGRPNAGKSTLTNALVGQKIAITTSKPQTTRHTIRGIVHRPDAQLILVDTPGLHRPRTLLGERLNDLVQSTLSEVDVIVFCLPADQKVGPGDRFITAQLEKLNERRVKTPVIAAVTKADLVSKEALAQHLLDVSTLMEFQEIIPVSAVGGYQVTELTDLLVSYMPEGGEFYLDGELTDEPESVMIAELVREAAIEGVRDELPHSLAVIVEEMIEEERQGKPYLTIHASIFVERDSQKGIIIGKQGTRLRKVGSQARVGIEALLGCRVYLDLRVKVAKDWQRDPKLLHKLGF